MTKKAKIINRLNTLSATEKETAIAFFSKHHNYENLIDWNNNSLMNKDSEKAFGIARNSHKRGLCFEPVISVVTWRNQWRKTNK